MAKEIGKMYVSLSVDARKYGQGLNKAQGRFAKFGKGIRAIASHWRAAAAATAAFTAAAVGAIAVITKITKGAVKYGEQADKMVKSIGITAEAWTKLAYAAEQEHTNQEVLGKGLMQLSKNMGYAKDGLATYLREFDRMGIKVTDAQGNLRDVTEVFMEMGDYMRDESVPTTQKTAVAMTLLGRAGKEALPFLKLTREELEALGNEADALGIVIDTKTAAAFKRIGDKILSIKTAFRGLGIIFATQFAPVIESVAIVVVDTAKKVIAFLKDNSEAIRIIVIGVSGGILTIINVTLKALHGLGVFTEKIVGVLAKLPGVLGGSAYKAMETLLHNTNEMMGDMTKGIDAAQEAMLKFNPTLEATGKALGDPDKPDSVAAGARAAKIAFENMTSGMIRGMKDLEPVFEKTRQTYEQWWASLWEEREPGKIPGLDRIGNDIEETARRIEAAASHAAAAFGDMFGRIIRGGEQAKFTFKDFLRLAAQLAGMLIGGPAGAFIGGAIGGMFQKGGIVPGFPGQPQLVMAHAGETIMNPKQINQLIAAVKEAASGGGHTTVYAMDSESFLEFGRREIPEVIRILRDEGRID